MQLNQRLNTFELKLRQLASKFERQLAEKKALEQENTTLKRELDRQKGVVSSLKERLEKALNATEGEVVETTTQPITDSDQVVATRAQIDACIEELDRCIEWLEKH